MGMKLILALLAAASLALFWALKVGRDFGEREMQAALANSDGWTEAEWQAAGWEAGW